MMQIVAREGILPQIWLSLYYVDSYIIFVVVVDDDQNLKKSIKNKKKIKAA